MVNTHMVNRESKSLKLVELRLKLPGKSEFLAFKTTVNYNRRSRINPGIS